MFSYSVRNFICKGGGILTKLSKTVAVIGFSHWVTDKYIYIMLLVYPLFVGFRGYTQLTASKFLFFAGLTVLWLAALLIGQLIRREKLNYKKPDFVQSCLLIYLLICCLSALCSPHKASVIIGEGRFDGLLTILLCCLIFFAISNFGQMKSGYIYALALSGFLCCVITIIQLFGANPLGLFPQSYDYYDAGIKYSSEFLGTIGNVDLFSAYMCLLLPLTSVYYIFSEKRPTVLLPVIASAGFCLLASRVSAGLLSVLCLAIAAAPLLICSSTRLRRGLEVLSVLCLAFCLAAGFHGEKASGEVAVSFIFNKAFFTLLILSAFFAIARLALRKTEFKTKTLRILFTSFSVFIVIAGLLTVFFWPHTSGTIYELSQVLHGNIDESFGSSRILIWTQTLKLVPEHLLLGGGPGTLALRLDVSFSRYVAETGNTLSTFVDNAHNEYLGILVNTGLLSLLSYALAQGASLWKAWRHREVLKYSLCLGAALLCYWIQSFFGLGLFIVSPLMWLLWGMLCSGFTEHESL